MGKASDYTPAWPQLNHRVPALISGLPGSTISPNIFGIRGQKFNGMMPLAAMSGAPTITTVTSDTTTIASPVTVARNSGNFRYPGTPVIDHPGVPGYYTPVLNGVTSALSWPWIVEFWSDAPKLALRVHDANSAYYVHIVIDGQLAHSAPISAGAVAAQHNLIEIDWTGVSKPRLYRVALHGTVFGGVYVGAADSVWFPSAQRKPVLCTFGDSYGDTFPTTGPGAQASLFAMIAWGLDMEHWNMNVWGSGYTQGGGYIIPGIVTGRLGYLSAMPDVILFAGGYNDRAQSQSTIGTNAASAFASAKQLAPKAKIIVLGPWTPQGEDTNLANTKATLNTQATAAGLPFIDISTLITANNKARYIRADLTHPTDADGHPYLGGRIAPLIHAQLAA